MIRDMLKAAMLTMILIGTTSCGQPKAYQDPEIMAVAEMVYEQMLSRSSDYDRNVIQRDGAQLNMIEMVFDDAITGNSFNGICRISFDPGRLNLKIMINESRWRSGTDAYKEQLMLHELVHCIGLYQEHDAATMFGSPLSIMHPYAMSDAQFSFNKDYYYQDGIRKTVSALLKAYSR